VREKKEKRQQIYLVVIEALFAFWKPAEFPACAGKTGKLTGRERKAASVSYYDGKRCHTGI